MAKVKVKREIICKRKYVHTCIHAPLCAFFVFWTRQNYRIFVKTQIKYNFFIGRLSVQKSLYNILSVLKEHNMIDRLSSQAINQQRSHKRISFLRVEFFIRTK